MPGPRRLKTVEELMTRDVVTLPREASVATAIRTLLGRGLDALPILDAGELVGIVDAHDLLGQPLYRTVGEIMPTDMATISPDAPVTEASQLMEARDIERVVVLKDNRLLGIITRRDIPRDVGTLTDPLTAPAGAVRPRRVVLHHAELEVTGLVATARVEVGYGSNTVVAKAVGRKAPGHGLALVAEATARGLNELLPLGTGVVVQDVHTLSIDGHGVLAHVHLLSPTMERRALGAVPAGEDAVAAAAMSVLHAVNRALEPLLIGEPREGKYTSS